MVIFKSGKQPKEDSKVHKTSDYKKEIVGARKLPKMTKNTSTRNQYALQQEKSNQ